MDYYGDLYHSVGWFIPPHVNMGYLGEIANGITQDNDFDLESMLSKVYSPAHLSTMVTHRYPIVPHICEYKEIISEAIDAHCLELHHVAASGLTPVVEGAGRKILEASGLSETYIKNVYMALATKCKNDVSANNIGAVNEIISLLDSFVYFTGTNLYSKSENHPHEDNTNRHGILHGAFADSDYGKPINFYKAIGAIEVLYFIVSTREPIFLLLM
ncbi:hypothetical protein J4N45_04530 [Vibrio sp. SCSIO 43140]|uniref:hypothetical protein n=1 Tax=Vibrio sp. SCSIO 43140 TaxID=2819100 RepID=UPI0020753720|nr:hypothetical protein [Vibrio sp. SCSIO 43140]USD61246.1 hypothetical protein J4N45_04530 [Vibrio sp. SCSIO 43140]